MNKKELLPKAKQIFESLPHCDNLLATSDGQFFEPTPANTGNVYSHADMNGLQVFTISKKEANDGITAEELAASEVAATDSDPVVDPRYEAPVVVEPIAPEQTENPKIEGDSTAEELAASEVAAPDSAPVVVEPITPEQTEKPKIEGDTTPAEATPETPKKEKKASK